MKEGIHPEYYQATVTCNCGNTFVTGSTKKDIHVEVCSKCHSFYTGQQKAARADGRIEKFNKKYGVGKNQVMYNKVEGYILNLILLWRRGKWQPCLHGMTFDDRQTMKEAFCEAEQ